MARVLVVEDEPAVGELIALNLRHAGHDVQVVARAEHAVEEIRQRLPDLIVLEWLLPGEPGLSLCKRWRNDARTKHVRLDAATYRAFGGSQEVRLGGTEFRLLHYLMCHPERVHSRAQLMDRVWGDHVFIEERTVDVHIKRLRDALAPTGCSMMEVTSTSGLQESR